MLCFEPEVSLFLDMNLTISYGFCFHLIF